MQITKNILTLNDCYTGGRTITVKGLMLHSIGTPQPDPMVFVRIWNRADVAKCVHAFIGGNGDVQQTLPWNWRGWHAGGLANATHIGVEMCEPKTIKYTGGSTYTNLDPTATRAFVMSTYKTAVELFAFLCKEYGLDPGKHIISHAEGYRLGVASNHGDPEHLWRAHGLTMAGFREAVKREMEKKTVPTNTTSYPVAYIGQSGENVKILQDNLTKLGFSPDGAVSGNYDAKTTDAVKRFQSAAGIVSDGQAGPITQATIQEKIAEIPTAKDYLSKGDEGEAVTQLQKNLVTLGFLQPEQVDGSFGPITDLAVRAFQKAAGLDPDGAVGKLTQASITVKLEQLIPTVLYRVRTLWMEPNSQLGAYGDLEAAKKIADANPGYSVFDENGNVVYISLVTPEPIPEPIPEPVEEPIPEIIPEIIKTPIMGDSDVVPEQMAAFVTAVQAEPKISVDIMELAKTFLEEGKIEGVRGDIAFAQAVKETGYFQFKGDVLAEQNNYAGIGAVGGGAKGQSFESARLGVRAQIQHLKAYASTEPLISENIDPRFGLVKRGIAPNWEDLNGKWAVPGSTYGQDILAIYEKIKAESIPEPVPVEEPTPEPQPTPETAPVLTSEEKKDQIKVYLQDEVNKIVDEILNRWF